MPGKKWEIAVDPADAGDGEMFVETVLHEYSHYLTLNNEQVKYTARQTASTYNEEGMVAYEGSYLDDFYQRFWADYLDDRLSDMDTYNFFLRQRTILSPTTPPAARRRTLPRALPTLSSRTSPSRETAVWERS